MIWLRFQCCQDKHAVKRQFHRWRYLIRTRSFPNHFAVTALTWALLVAGAAVFIHRLLSLGAVFGDSPVDFGYFYYAANLVWHHGSPSHLYDIGREHRWMLAYLSGITPVHPYDQYIYPPQFAVLLAWVAAFAPHTASIIWYALSTVFYLSSIGFLCTIIKSNHWRILFLSIALMFSPYGSDLMLGNVDWLIFSLLSLSLYLYRNRNMRLIAGIVVGISIVLKITPILFLFLGLAKKDWRYTWGVVASLIATTTLSFLVVGFEPFRYYLTHFLSMSALSAKNALIYGPGWNSSLSVLLPELSGTSFLFYLADALILFVTFKAVRKPPSDSLRNYALVSVCMLLISPVVEDHHLIILLFSIVYVIRTLETVEGFGPLWHRVRLTILSILLVLSTAVGPSTVYNAVIPLHYLVAMVGFFIWIAFFPPEGRETKLSMVSPE